MSSSNVLRVGEEEQSCKKALIRLSSAMAVRFREYHIKLSHRKIGARTHVPDNKKNEQRLHFERSNAVELTMISSDVSLCIL